MAVAGPGHARQALRGTSGLPERPALLDHGPDHRARAGEILSFDGLDARWVAELPIPPELDVTGPPAGRYYRDITIKRQTEWIFAAGRPVYELLTPDRQTYIMQAFSHIVDDGLTQDSLPALGDRLHPPQDWHFRARTPDRDLTLRTVAGQAHVLQDELQNTYMRLMTE